MKPQPKHKRISLPDYLAWIRTQPCCVCGRTPTVAAHQRLVGDGSVGRKPSDLYAIPLCASCHNREHQGAATFYKEIGKDAYRLIVETLVNYYREREGK